MALLIEDGIAELERHKFASLLAQVCRSRFLFQRTTRTFVLTLESSDLYDAALVSVGINEDQSVLNEVEGIPHQYLLS